MTRDALEQRLIAAVAEGDVASLLVYADLLEEHGDDDRAEYLRLTEIMRLLPSFDDRYLECETRYHRLADRIDPAWRASLRTTPRSEGAPLPGISRTEPARRGGFSLSELLAWVFERRRPRTARPLELPEQLRYLEALPATAPASTVMMPRRR